MTGKERAAWRKEANGLTAAFQIGKEAATPELVAAIDAYLKKHELVKVSVLQNCELETRAAAETLAGALAAEVIQCIGRKLVLYREKEEETHA